MTETATEKTPEVEILEALIKSIVDDVDEVFVEPSEDKLGTVLTVYVSRRDMGKVIGKGGDMANAIRKILKSVGAKNNRSVHMRVAEPGSKSYAVGPEKDREAEAETGTENGSRPQD